MKRTIVGLCILGIVFLLAMPAATVAKETKPQKTQCYLLDGSGVGTFDQTVMLLGAKSSGVTGKDVDDKLKYYNNVGSIITTGHPDPWPFIGSTYYHQYGALFGQISGMYVGLMFGCTLWMYDDVSLGADVAFCHMINIDASVDDESSAYGLSEVDCKDYDFNNSTFHPGDSSTEGSGVSNHISITGN